jgi:hypothetical protein
MLGAGPKEKLDSGLWRKKSGGGYGIPTAHRLRSQRRNIEEYERRIEPFRIVEAVISNQLGRCKLRDSAQRTSQPNLASDETLLPPFSYVYTSRTIFNNVST